MEALFLTVYQWGISIDRHVSFSWRQGSESQIPPIKWRLKGVWKLFTACANGWIKAAWRGENSWWFRICFPVSRNTPVREVCGGRGPQNALAFCLIISKWCILYNTCHSRCVKNYDLPLWNLPCLHRKFMATSRTLIGTRWVKLIFSKK